MLLLKLSTGTIEPICYEHWNVVTPAITRGCREQYPLVGFSNLEERFHPCATAYYSLLVEDEERSGNGFVFLDVISAIDNHSMVIHGNLRIRGK